MYSNHILRRKRKEGGCSINIRKFHHRRSRKKKFKKKNLNYNNKTDHVAADSRARMHACNLIRTPTDDVASFVFEVEAKSTLHGGRPPPAHRFMRLTEKIDAKECARTTTTATFTWPRFGIGRGATDLLGRFPLPTFPFLEPVAMLCWRGFDSTRCCRLWIVQLSKGIHSTGLCFETLLRFGCELISTLTAFYR